MKAKEIKENYDILENYVEMFFDEERKKKVLKVFDHFQNRIIIAPASYKKEYHSAFPGGFLSHTINVIKNAVKLYKVWDEQNGINNFEIKEVIFAAMFHDWGKLGDIEESYYIPQKSDWHRKRGMLYEFNPKLKGYMKVPIRSIFILQHFGIKMTQSEFLGIMLSDGMFDDINKVYFHNLKTNLPLIIHHADHMSVMCEKVKLKKEDNKKLEHFKEIFKGEK